MPYDDDFDYFPNGDFDRTDENGDPYYTDECGSRIYQFERVRVSVPDKIVAKFMSEFSPAIHLGTGDTPDETAISVYEMYLDDAKAFIFEHSMKRKVRHKAEKAQMLTLVQSLGAEMSGVLDKFEKLAKGDDDEGTARLREILTTARGTLLNATDVQRGWTKRPR